MMLRPALQEKLMKGCVLFSRKSCPYCWWGTNGAHIFDDGTIWSHDDALRATVAAISAGDLIEGQAGNDRLIGQKGNDTLDGGAAANDRNWKVAA